MKKLFFSLMLGATAVGLIGNLSSCKDKDKGTPPNISFITGTGYTSADASLQKGTTVKIGINASAAEEGDVLKTLNVSKSRNGAADVTDTTITISSAQQNSYTNDFSYTVDTTVGTTVKYTYTVTNRDGITNNVKLTVTSTN